MNMNDTTYSDYDAFLIPFDSMDSLKKNGTIDWNMIKQPSDDLDNSSIIYFAGSIHIPSNLADEILVPNLKPILECNVDMFRECSNMFSSSDYYMTYSQFFDFFKPYYDWVKEIGPMSNDEFAFSDDYRANSQFAIDMYGAFDFKRLDESDDDNPLSMDSKKYFFVFVKTNA